MKLLIVDDSREARLILSELMIYNGFEVREAVNGAEALELIEKETPDIIISDILMPVMDGFKLLKTLNEKKITEIIPFVFYTSNYISDEDRDFGLALGASRFLIKPMQPLEILSNIKSVVKEFETGESKYGKPAITSEKYLEKYNQRISLKLESKILELEEEIKKRNVAQEALKLSEEKYRTLIDNIQDGVFIIQDSRFQFVNEAFARIAGYSVGEMIGMDFRELVAPEDMEMVADRYFRRQKGEDILKEYEFRVLHRSGERKIVNMNVGLINYMGRVASMGTIKDITERKQAEIALKESEERYRLLLESSPFGIAIHCDRKLIYVNSEGAKILGAESPGEIIGKSVFDIIHPDYHKITNERIHMQEAGKAAPRIEEKFIKVDGTPVEVEVIATPFVHKGKLSMYGVFQDITNRKQAEEALKESEERHRRLVESCPFGITIHSDCKIVYVNSEAVRILGAENREQLIGKSIFEIVHQDYHGIAKTRIRMQEAGKIAPLIEEKFLRIDGSSVDVEVMAIPFMYKGRLSMYGVFQDITKRRRAEEQIRQSLKEKEILLREVHHRVKNNMQIISGLLQLQSDNIGEIRYKELFKESQNRIMTMSLIHEKLYRSINFASIDFENYIRDMVNILFQSYGVNADNITLNLNIENIQLGIDSAIPCGLIINELVTNSLKYAFPDGRKGEIGITLSHTKNNDIELVVKDSGVGIPDDFDLKKSKSLGLYLVGILAENQLDGELNLNRSKGTEFRIKFKGGK